MIIDIRSSGEMILASLEGELDHHTSQAFKAKVQKILDTEVTKNLVIDMSRLNFMDSSGIGVILGRLNQLKKKGGKVVVFGMQSQVKKVFYAGGLDKVIPYYEKEEEAVNNI